jgi:DNA-binding transcriptional LysR family regulator
LEDQIGAKLFLRSVRGMELTEAGRALFEDARDILSLVDTASERARRAAQGLIGRLDVGIFGSGVFDIVPRILGRFRIAFPEVKIVLHPMNKTEQLEALRQHRINIGFNRLVPRYSDIGARVAMWERLYAVVPQSGALASRKVISIADLAGLPFILFPRIARPNFGDFVASLCQQHGFSPHIAQEVGDAVTGVSLVANGFGVCIVAESTTNFRLGGVSYLALESSPPALLDITCLYNKGDRSPIVTEFLAVLEEFRRENKVVGEAPALML